MTNQDLIIIKSSLSRACAYSRAPCTFALFAFTTFTDLRVIHSILVDYRYFINIFLMFHAEWREKWAKRPRRRGKLGGKAGGSATRAVEEDYSVFLGCGRGG